MAGESLLEAYPLTWPEGRPRTKNRRAAKFEVSLGQARDELQRSLANLGARQIVVSSNAKVRRDGLIAADATEPADPGVAVYFDRRVAGEWKPFVIACDSFAKLRWNVRAIGLTVEALRAIARYGASEMLEQAFTGFLALPPARAADAPWWVTLGVREDSPRDTIREAYRMLAMQHHPDRGGDDAAMAAINRAFEASGAKT